MKAQEVAVANETRSETSHLGKSFRFKGEMSGSEDIFIDGQVEGSIHLSSQVVTIGPNGNVNAEIQAREMIVHGKLKGNAQAQDRIEVTRTGSVQGDMSMARISIQDGAFFQGRVDIRVPAAAIPIRTPTPAPVAVGATAATGASAGSSSSSNIQPSLLEKK